MNENPKTITTDQIRAGETKGHMRYVLIISVILAVAVMLWLAFGTPIAPQDDIATGPTPEQIAPANRDPGTGQATPAP